MNDEPETEATVDVTEFDLAELRRDAEQVLAPRAKFAPTDPPVYIGHEPAPGGPDTRLARFALAMTDPTAVREAAERYIEDRDGAIHLLPPNRGRACAKTLADAYLAEHDPAPLTVERLVEMGGKREGETIHWNGFEIMMPFPEATTWRWWYHGSRQHFSPRTAGQLAMLLAMMEGR